MILWYCARGAGPGGLVVLGAHEHFAECRKKPQTSSACGFSHCRKPRKVRLKTSTLAGRPGRAYGVARFFGGGDKALDILGGPLVADRDKTVVRFDRLVNVIALVAPEVVGARGVKRFDGVQLAAEKRVGENLFEPAERGTGMLGDIVADNIEGELVL